MEHLVRYAATNNNFFQLPLNGKMELWSIQMTKYIETLPCARTATPTNNLFCDIFRLISTHNRPKINTTSKRKKINRKAVSFAVKMRFYGFLTFLIVRWFLWKFIALCTNANLNGIYTNNSIELISTNFIVASRVAAVSPIFCYASWLFCVTLHSTIDLILRACVAQHKCCCFFKWLYLITQWLQLFYRLPWIHR